MAYQDLPPDEHPTVIKIDHVIYVRADVLPDPRSLDDYALGANRWMCTGYNEALEEIKRIVEGKV